MVFIESRTFTTRLRQLVGAAEGQVLQQIQNELLKDPERGDVVQGSGGIRKARTSHPGRRKGSRGGLRYFYLFLSHKQHIHLLALLDKGEREDLTQPERKALRALVEEIRRK